MSFFLLILIGLALLLSLVAWITSSTLRQMLFCPWCWQDCHVRRWYPERWSSTICVFHAKRMLAEQAARRRRRIEVCKEVF